MWGSISPHTDWKSLNQTLIYLVLWALLLLLQLQIPVPVTVCVGAQINTIFKEKNTHTQINCENCGKAESFELQKCVFEWLCAGFEALLCTTVINWPGSCHGMKLCKEINRWVTSEAMYWLQKTHLNLLSPLHGDCVLKPVRFEAWNWVYFYEFSPNSSH